MTSRRLVLITAILVISIGMYEITNFQPFTNNKEKKIFPGIIGDTILKDNETGFDSVKNMTLYDDFKGNMTKGYRATYSGNNGTMIVFIAQMPDNMSAYNSLEDMAVRLGYNKDESNNSSPTNPNATIIKLPIKNPDVFVIQKNNSRMWHYTFSKLDKVYWIGFSNPDMQYQSNMLIEVYRNVDAQE